MNRIMIIFFTLFSLVSFAHNEKKPVTLCFENSQLYPYLTDKEKTNTEEAGLLVDIIIKSFLDEGIDVKVLRKPWKRCLNDVKFGQIDGTAALLWSKERSAAYSFPKDKENHFLWQPRYMIFTHKESKLKYEAGKIHNQKLALSSPKGYLITSKLLKKGVTLTKEFSPLKAMNLLERKRIDGYIIEEQIGNFYVKSLKLQNQIKVLENPFHEDYFYFVFSNDFKKKHPKLTQKIWENIASRRNKTSQKLLKYYFSKEVIEKYKLIKIDNELLE